MYERIIEIIVLVLSQLTQNKKIADIDIDDLSSRGYTQEEITSALSWIVDRLENTQNFLNSFNQQSDTSFRILSSNEIDLFSKEAWGEVINLHNLGLLKNEHIESLIDWASLIGIDKMTQEQLKDYLALNIFKFQSNGVDGAKYIYMGDQSIN